MVLTCESVDEILKSTIKVIAIEQALSVVPLFV